LKNNKAIEFIKPRKNQKIAKKCKYERLREEFVLLREEYQQQHGRAHDDYHARIEEAIKSDPKVFFGYVDLKKSVLATHQLCILKVVWPLARGNM
jgi:predicted LPLAT superfamily acyltransferase